MSNRIDRFIEAMFRKKAERLCFLTGTPVRIVTGGVEKIILDKQVRTDQIDKLVIPILGDDDADVFCGDNEGVFFYRSAAGRVRIESKRRGPKVAVEITQASGDDPAASNPALEVDVGDNQRSVSHSDAEMDLFGSDAKMPAISQPRPPSEERPKVVMDEIVSADARPKPMTRSFRLVGGGRGGTPAIDKIVTQLATEGGSDLHMTTGQVPKMRKDGEIMNMSGWPEPLTSDRIEQWMLEVAAPRIREQYLETHDADYAYEVEGISRYRMNIFRDRNGTGAVIRTIPSEILTFEQLGLPPPLKAFCELPKGMVLVTGPTGSGKSTTLAAMIDYINKKRTDHIITIEDPVEFVHQSRKCLINQREVHTHTESFSRALRAALREDPDIVLVGEMRDLETVHIAIETAETGHLVFGTLHTNTAASTVDRIIDQFPTDRQSQIRVMLSETLRGVVSQTLCRRIGGGRVACLEILIVTNAICNLIREGKTFQIASIMQTGRGLGMQMQADAMIQLVKDEKIEPLEAFTRAVDQELMRRALERAGHTLPVA